MRLRLLFAPPLSSPLVYTPLAVCLGTLLVQPAQAQHRENHGHDYGQAHQGHSDFHGRDFHHFTPNERHAWEGGHWVHGWHDNRFAWWWVTGGGWYFYPQPVYPYPRYVPPAIVMQQPPPEPRGMPPAQFWYYCANPPGYYPYVASCGVPWQQVPVPPR